MSNAQYIDYYCHFDGPLGKHLVCAEFYFARLRGEIVANRDDGCWEMPGSAPRNMSWRARFYAEGRGEFDDNSGDLYRWYDCPFCGGETEAVDAKPRPLLPPKSPPSNE